MDIVEEMLETNRFEFSMPFHNGKWIQTLDLVCKNEVCDICPHSIWVDGGLKTECYYSTVDEKTINEYLINHKPKMVFKFIKEMRLPEDTTQKWFRILEEKYPPEEYPELWV